MGWIDIVVLALLGLAVFLGFKKGLVQEIVGIIALAVSFFAAVLLHAAAAAMLRGVFPRIPGQIAPTIGFAVVFLLAFAAITAAGWLMSKVIKATPLDFADKLGGMAVGLVKGALVVSIMLLLLAFLPLPREAADRLDRSAVVRTVRRVAPWVYRQTQGLWPKAKELYQDLQQTPPAKKVDDLKKTI
jgi:membrane protein required for colicin V production